MVLALNAPMAAKNALRRLYQRCTTTSLEAFCLPKSQRITAGDPGLGSDSSAPRNRTGISATDRNIGGAVSNCDGCMSSGGHVSLRLFVIGITARFGSLFAVYLISKTGRSWRRYALFRVFEIEIMGNVRPSSIVRRICIRCEKTFMTAGLTGFILRVLLPESLP